MELKAQWIWRKQKNYTPYNQAIVARKEFRLGRIKKAVIAITADSYYRLFINDEWVNDGPCRSWPEHYQYDEIDVTTHLRPGVNEVKVIARYFGVGTYHQVPEQAGLLAQLEVAPIRGKKIVLCSDDNWEVAEARSWIWNTPKVSNQMEPCEHYDARLESPMRFSRAAALFDAHKGPWKNLNPRDCALLTRKSFAFKNFLGANVVRSDWMGFTFAVGRLLHPGLINASWQVGIASAVATIIVSKKTQKVRIESADYNVTVNGKKSKAGAYEILPGRNLLFAVVSHPFGFRSRSIRFVDTGTLKIENPLRRGYENPWCFVPLEEGSYVNDDMVFMRQPNSDRETFMRQTQKKLGALLKQVVSVESLKRLFGKRALCVPSHRMFDEDPYRQFLARDVIGDAASLVENPSGLMYDNGELTVVRPSAQGDVELAYDLGEQNCGYYDIELVSDAGVAVDIFGIEYISPSGKLQHTIHNRNGLRYICRDGVNRFLSLKRRSGKYIYITFRNLKRPVQIRKIQLIESTYPVTYQGSFSCSDPFLDKIWEISARTLKLCMEDTFTDCPLYEQTLWVGDARNEALFAYTPFGATDLSKRCLKLAGQSLELYPLVGCQVPSSWDCMLPAWSFLWGIAVWEYFLYTGDKSFLKDTWKWVKRNLKSAEKLVDDRGLFSAPFWNMFDWVNVDHNHETVIHNSMFVVGAINAALKCTDVLKDAKTKAWLTKYRCRLVKAINRLWDDKARAYPDSIHEDGTVSTRTCQHTSFLAILYDIVERRNLRHALNNILNPPKGMVKVGNPFAIMYLYETFEKIHLDDEIIKSIYENYAAMVRDHATTVWEAFSSSTLAHGEFPTRSHAHGWSAAPVHFLNRIVLGIKQTAVGGTAFQISPRLSGLKWANGATATTHGPVRADWQIDGKHLTVNASGPKGVMLRFVRNDTHKELTAVYNGKKV